MTTDLTIGDTAPLSFADRFGGHARGLTDASGVRFAHRPSYDVLRVNLAQVAKHQMAMRVTAVPGSGKSFMVARAVDWLRTQTDIDVHWVTLAGRTFGRELIGGLLFEVTGVPARSGDSIQTIRTGLLEHLRNRPCLIVCDEAQLIEKQPMQQLRFIFDQYDVQMALLFVGTPKLLASMPAEVASRCSADVRIPVLDDDEVVAVLRSFHEMFADAEARLLKRFNRVHAGRSFRWWANFVVRALPVVADGTLSADIAAQVAAHMPRSEEGISQ